MMASSTPESGSIKAISKAATHRICSGQVILDLATASKELVENAVDAGATNIEVRLKEYGSEMIELADNGSGIKPEDYQALTLKYHTSKIKEFDDLSGLSTFGFRGEALSSLCAVSSMSVVTRTEEQEVGTKIMFDHEGHISSQTPCPRGVGTTIGVKDLFKTLPVRHKELLKNVKREYAKMVVVLQAYALISTKVRMLATNQAGKGSRSVVISTRGGSSTLRDNIINVFGTKVADTLQPLDFDLPLSGGPGGADEVEEKIHISGYVSRANVGMKGGGDSSRQFFYLNGRPVDLPKATKTLNDVYRSLGSAATSGVRPMVVLNLEIPTTTYDINVTPDKRKVFMEAEGQLVAALEKALKDLWEPSRYTFALNSVAQAPTQGIGRAELSQPMPFSKPPSQRSAPTQEGVGQPLTTPASRGAHQTPMKSNYAVKEEVEEEEELGPSSAGPGSRPEQGGLSPGGSLMPCQLGRVEAKSELSPAEATPGNCPESATLIAEGGERSARKSDFLAKLLARPQAGRLGSGGIRTVDFSRFIQPGIVTSGLAGGAPSQPTTVPGVTDQRKQLLMDSFVAVSAANPACFEPSSRSRNSDLKDSEIGVDDEGTGTAPPALRSPRRGACAGGLEPAAPMESEEEEAVSRGDATEEGDDAVAMEEGVDADGVDHTQSRLPAVQGALARFLAGNRRSETCNTSLRQTEAMGVQGTDGMEVAFGADEMASPSASPPGTSSGQEGEECLVLEPSNTARERESVVVNFDMDAQRRLVAQQCEISRKRVAAMLAGEEASQAAAKRARRFASSSLQAADASQQEGGRAEAEAAAERELERVFCKQDFKALDVIGQFNLGFILAKLGRDVFIVDQHAADEKYNFERLQRIAQPTRQPLLCPKSLGLTPLDDMIIKDNIDTFRRNGFDFVEDESTGALLLSAVPCSKRTFTFGADDCMEMVAMLKAGERPEDIRPTKVRAMFASRACRTSIMIGKALEVSQMYRVLEHLSGLVAPWNCPHGRPTMRHVCVLPKEATQLD